MTGEPDNVDPTNVDPTNVDLANGDAERSAPAREAATLGAANRLKTQRHFRRVYKRGRRASGHWMTVVGVMGRPSEGVRVGLSVSKQHGGAVRRNKIKRLLREAFRSERHRLPPGLDLVLIPQQREEHYPLREMKSELVLLVERLLHGPTPDRRGGARRSRDTGKSKSKSRPKNAPESGR